MNRITNRLSDYFLPKVLYESTSVYNKDIKVIEVLGTKKLVVNGYPQSYEYPSKFSKERVWGQIASLVHKKKPYAKNILLLGMGAGTMLHYIAESFGQRQPQITSVEIDKEVVEVAKKFFNLEAIKNNKIIIENAYKVLDKPKNYNLDKKFDCIIVDTYLGNKRTGEFDKKHVEKLKEILNDNGFLIFNIVIPKKESKQTKHYLNIFSELGLDLNIQKIKSYGESDNYLYFGNHIFNENNTK